MAVETARRRRASPLPLDSPSPAQLVARKDGTYLGNGRGTALMDVSSPLSTAHASLVTEPARATILSRPRSPTGFRADGFSASKDPLHQHPLQSDISSNEHTKDWAQSKPLRNKLEPLASSRNGNVKSSNVTRSSERTFYRRLLFQDLPSGEAVPAITSNTDLDHEIYLLLAYLLRETILPWYGKLTPDRELLTQITSIIVTILQRLAKRLSTSSDSDADKVELERVHAFLSHELPLILRQHFVEYRAAQSKAGSIWAPSVNGPSLSSGGQVETQLGQETIDALAVEATVSPADLAKLYLAASSHPGFKTEDGILEGKVDLTYMRIATVSLLSSILPPSDFVPDTERFIVRDVLVTVLRGVIAKPTRPWFVTQSIHKALDAAGWTDGHRSDSNLSGHDSGAPSSIGSVAIVLARFTALLLRFWTFLILTVLPTVTRTYLELFNVQNRGNHRRQGSTSNIDPTTMSSMSRSWSTASLHERRMHGRFPSEIDSGHFRPDEPEPVTASHQPDPLPGPYVASWISLLEEVCETHSSHLLNALFGFIKVGLGAFALDHHADRVITVTINRKANDFTALAVGTRKIREALLPGGHLPPPAVDPDQSTQATEWARLRTRIVFGMPLLMRKALLGRDFDTQFQNITRWLEPVCAPQAAGPNTFLGVMLFERILVMLCPDMSGT